MLLLQGLGPLSARDFKPCASLNVCGPAGRACEPRSSPLRASRRAWPQRKGNSNTNPPTARASRHGPLRRAARASRPADRRVAPPRQTSHRLPQTYTSHHLPLATDGYPFEVAMSKSPQLQGHSVFSFTDKGLIKSRSPIIRHAAIACGLHQESWFGK